MNYSNAAECAMPSQPSFMEIHGRLLNCIDRYDGLTNELNNKLQTIQRYDEPCPLKNETTEKQPDCIVDELFRLISRLSDYNDRIEVSLRHLNQIV